MRMSGADGFGAAAPARIVDLGNATMTVVTAEHLPKVIRRKVYYGDEPSCQGYEVCAFVNWMDEEWHGRSQSIITKLVENNVKLKMKLADVDCTISTMKEEIINHMQQMKARDKKEQACIVVVVA
ncbi:hypothetical protein D1007_02693 [Hordeum vulgare]|nr:hypothetical protein D1007_02693 [Hordeum vulgare]